ncbi:MAG: hypothetical protein H7Y15_04750 [Pseudonocardia sp.]|nr:hypothetical protein [Pseudonocardia sp.]
MCDWTAVEAIWLREGPFGKPDRLVVEAHPRTTLIVLRHRRVRPAGRGSGLGALASNAGDDFHFWWAAGRTPDLIRPGTVSRLLAVEGFPRIDDPDDQYKVVDVTEYLGGVTFDDATAVLVSQLKYSTRHPTRQWTAAQICRKRSRRGSGGDPRRPRSVVADLAGTYRQLVEKFGRDATLGKARIRLVSNQPEDPELTGAVTAAAQWASEQGRPVRRADVLGALAENEVTVVRALADAVGNSLTMANSLFGAPWIRSSPRWRRRATCSAVRRRCPSSTDRRCPTRVATRHTTGTG